MVFGILFGCHFELAPFYLIDVVQFTEVDDDFGTAIKLWLKHRDFAFCMICTILFQEYELIPFICFSLRIYLHSLFMLCKYIQSIRKTNYFIDYFNSWKFDFI